MNTQKIAEALHAAGYQPTEQLIQAVIREKSTDGRISLASAIRRAVQNAAPDNGQSHSNAPTGSADNVGDTLKATTEALAKSIKKKVLTDALQIVISDFSVGDFGGFDIDLGESQTLDVDFSQVLNSSAFTALPATSHGTSQQLLSASTEDGND